MPQIQKGDTFVDGQIVNGTRLNQFLDSAILLPSAITDQTALSSNTLATDDKFLIYDTSASVLKSASASTVFGSGIPITLDTINVVNYKNLVAIPNVAQSSVSATFTTANSNKTVIVGSMTHGLNIGDWVWITGVENPYQNRYPISAITENTFTYNVPVAGVGTNGTLSFLKIGTFRVGTVNDNGNIGAVGNLFASKNLVVDGTAVINGTTYNNGAVTQSGVVTQSGTVNITGALQTKGVPALVLYEVKIDSISNMVGAGNGSTVNTHATQNNQVRGAGGAGWWGSQGFTHYNETIIVPAGEQWEIEYSPIEIMRDTDDTCNFVALINGNPNFDLQGIPFLRYAGFTFKTHFNLATGTHTVLWKSVIVNGSGADALYMNVYNNCHRIVRKYKVS